MQSLSSGVVVVKDEIEEGNDSKPKTPPSPLNSSTPPGERVNDEAVLGRKKSLSSSSTFRRLSMPSSKFWEIANEKDEISRVVPTPSSNSLRERLSILAHKITWDLLKQKSKEWFRNPMNLALFVWILVVAISGAILFLVMTGMLNGVLPKKSQRNAWFEVNNQILNALFTLMCLYQHPQRFYHLALLLRWNPEDISRLRKIYCKHGTYKPHEWAHMLVVVLLLHLNCFAQYALCGLNVGYKRSERPPIGVAVCISVAIAAPAIAGVYLAVSPLGKEYDYSTDEEAQTPINLPSRKTCEKRLSFMVKAGNIVENKPEWQGGIFDFWNDLSVAYLSLFCSFCVFGWNMERLGFGNMYVHIAMFILFCTAPFWIFNLAAINLNDDTVRQALGITGVVLCVFGLLYGGYWRIQMRKRFNLPAYTSCCGKPAISDCALWLCCCWCSLAQEVRTANFYEIVQNKLLRRPDENVELGSVQLSREEGEMTTNSSCPTSPILMQPVEKDASREDTVGIMTPPSPVLIGIEGK